MKPPLHFLFRSFVLTSLPSLSSFQWEGVLTKVVHFLPRIVFRPKEGSRGNLPGVLKRVCVWE